MKKINLKPFQEKALESLTDEFLHKWKKIEQVFDRQGHEAIRDILSNYGDWYYLYGQELERR